MPGSSALHYLCFVAYGPLPTVGCLRPVHNFQDQYNAPARSPHRPHQSRRLFPRLFPASNPPASLPHSYSTTRFHLRSLRKTNKPRTLATYGQQMHQSRREALSDMITTSPGLRDSAQASESTENVRRAVRHRSAGLTGIILTGWSGRSTSVACRRSRRGASQIRDPYWTSRILLSKNSG